MRRGKDRLIAGVCSGLAKRLGVDALVTRLLFIGAFLFCGAGPILYLILWLLMPSEE